MFCVNFSDFYYISIIYKINLSFWKNKSWGGKVNMGSEYPLSLHPARDLNLEKVNKARNKAKAKAIHVVRNTRTRILFSLLNSRQWNKCEGSRGWNCCLNIVQRREKQCDCSNPALGMWALWKGRQGGWAGLRTQTGLVINPKSQLWKPHKMPSGLLDCVEH